MEMSCVRHFQPDTYRRVGRKDRHPEFASVSFADEMQILQKWSAPCFEFASLYSTELRSSRLLSSLPRPASEPAGALPKSAAIYGMDLY